MAERASEIVAEVFRRVLIPAVTGGELAIEKPFGFARARAAGEAVGFDEADLEMGPDRQEVERDAGAVTLDRGEEALLRRLRRLCGADVPTVVPRIEGGTVMAAALIHDVIAAFHPELPGAFRRDAANKLLDATARAFANIDPPATVRGALLRHAWLGELPRFQLVRTELKWWVGGASFVGRAPPSRLLAWPDLRRVRRDERSAEILRLPELFADRSDVSSLAELHARAMAGFFAASPFTDLAYAGRLAPPFSWTPLLAKIVATPASARLARRAIGLGEEGGKYAREVLAGAGEAASGLL